MTDLTNLYASQYAAESRIVLKPATKIELYSEDRLQSENTESDSCIWQIDHPIFPNTSTVLDVVVDSIHLPNSMYLINSANNTFTITEDGQAAVDIVLTEGDYNAHTIAAELSTKCTTALRKTYVVSYASNTDKLTFTQTEADSTFTVTMTAESPFDELGFLPLATVEGTGGAPVISVKPINLIGVDAIYLRSNLPNTNSYSSKTGTFTHMIARVPVSVPFGEVIEAQGYSSWSVIMPMGAGISRIEIDLVDKNGNRINLNGLDWNISLVVSEKFAK